MLKKLSLLLLSMALCFATDTANPTSMLENVSNKLITQLSINKDKIAVDKTFVDKIITEVLLPKVDAELMTKMVVGPTHWRSASLQQQKDLVGQFVIMVTNNYAKLFAEYSNQTVSFVPFRGDLANSNRIEVNSFIQMGSKNNFKVVYRLTKTPDNSWLIYDFSIDGISMIESYKSQFSPVLSADGLSGLITSMKTHNTKK